MTKPFENTVRGIITRYEGVPLGDTEAQVQAIIKAHTAAVEEAVREELELIRLAVSDEIDHALNEGADEALNHIKQALAARLAQLKEQPK